MKKIIFDTDLGGDCDDVMALDLLLACEKTGECRLTGVTYSADARRAVECIHSILRRYGRGCVPIGRAPIEAGIKPVSDNYATQVAEAFPGGMKYEEADDAVRLLRKLLASGDPSVLCVTGFLTNVAALLASPPDDISPLEGRELAAKQLSELVIMGCSFGPGGKAGSFAEWNIQCDINAARQTVSLCPAPIVICPFEVGLDMITGAAMTAKGGRTSPDSLSYIVHGSAGGRHSWDPATALYAVRGAGRLFTLSDPGICVIAEDGISSFTRSPGGRHRYLECAVPKADIAAEIDRTVAVL